MNQRWRDEQETRNAIEVMVWIEHLAAHPGTPVDLDVVCHVNRLVLRGTDRDHYYGLPITGAFPNGCSSSPKLFATP